MLTPSFRRTHLPFLASCLRNGPFSLTPALSRWERENRSLPASIKIVVIAAIPHLDQKGLPRFPVALAKEPVRVFDAPVPGLRLAGVAGMRTVQAGGTICKNGLPRTGRIGLSLGPGISSRRRSWRDGKQSLEPPLPTINAPLATTVPLP